MIPLLERFKLLDMISGSEFYKPYEASFNIEYERMLGRMQHKNLPASHTFLFRFKGKYHIAGAACRIIERDNSSMEIYPLDQKSETAMDLAVY